MFPAITSQNASSENLTQLCQTNVKSNISLLFMFFDCCVNLAPPTAELFCSGPCGFAARLNLLFSVCKKVKATHFLRNFDPSRHVCMSYMSLAVPMRTKGSCLFSLFQHKRGM